MEIVLFKFLFVVLAMEDTLTSHTPSEPTPGSSPQEVGAPYLQGAAKPDAPAQKLSKQSGSKAARSRDDSRMIEYNRLFGEKKFTRFFSIKPVGKADLTKLNMFKVDRTICDMIGTCRNISEDFKERSWTVEVISEDQGNRLLKLKKLVKENVTVVAHDTHNQSQGVITCSLLKGYSDEDIAEGLAEQGVMRCRRIVKGMKSPKPEPTTTLILTFNTSTPPSRINIRTGLQERVRPYVPLPMRCFNCQEYGHTGSKCRKQVTICGRCGTPTSESHSPDNCERPARCYHCDESHSVASKTCPRYLLEKEIITIKTKEHVSFAEARAKVMRDFPSRTRSYATAAMSTPALEQAPLPIAVANSNTLSSTVSQDRSSTKRPPESRDSSPEESRAKERKTESALSQLFELTETRPGHVNASPGDMEDRTPNRRSSVPNAMDFSQAEGKILNNARKKKIETKKQSRQTDSK